jgi:putative thioredoxin
MDHDLKDFQADVIDRSRTTPVLVDFWAPWCGPCKMLGPVLEKLAGDAAGRWTLVKINTDENGELSAQFEIRSIPSVKLFSQGAVIAEFAGAMPEPQLRRWLGENMPTPKRDTMAKAREWVRSGLAGKAAQILLPLAKADPDDEELAALTARALVFSEPKEAMALVAKFPAGIAWEEMVTMVREFARVFALIDDPPAELAASRIGVRYVSAIRALRAEQYGEALAGLVAVLDEKPSFDGSHAKAVTLAIFKHLGMRHALTDAHFRAYSMAVNA